MILLIGGTGYVGLKDEYQNLHIRMLYEESFYE